MKRKEMIRRKLEKQKYKTEKQREKLQKKTEKQHKEIVKREIRKRKITEKSETNKKPKIQNSEEDLNPPEFIKKCSKCKKNHHDDLFEHQSKWIACETCIRWTCFSCKPKNLNIADEYFCSPRCRQ